jgi:hypothetical protein
MMILARKILREYLIFDLYIVFYVIVTCEFNVDEVEQRRVCFKVFFLFKFCEYFKDSSHLRLPNVYLIFMEDFMLSFTMD